jgi:hypothetical protein
MILGDVDLDIIDDVAACMENHRQQQPQQCSSSRAWIIALPALATLMRATANQYSTLTQAWPQQRQVNRLANSLLLNTCVRHF